MTTHAIDRAAQTLWNYHRMNHTLRKADLLFLLGSHDLRVADYTAQLFSEGWAPQVIVSGGVAHKDDLLNTGWKKSEAEILGERLLEKGIPKGKLLLETKASNTGENVNFCDKILRATGIPFQTIIAVQKPYMERRTYATIKIHWPARDLLVTSPPLKMQEYPNEEISREDMINLMVGDLQRIAEYPNKGFQIPQEIPEDVQRKYELLVQAGFTKHMIR